MINKLTAAFRSLNKKKFYTLINILGLSVSLATSILIIMWVQDEHSFDKFHSDHEQLYTVNSHINPGMNGSIWTSSPAPIARFAQHAPRVDLATRVAQDHYSTVVNDSLKRLVNGTKIAYVDSNFFAMFNFPLVDGSLVSFQTNHTNALVSESTAIKLFNTQQAIGETFRYGEDFFTVTGVLQDVPANSSIRFDVVIPLGYYAQRSPNAVETANGRPSMRIWVITPSKPT